MRLALYESNEPDVAEARAAAYEAVEKISFGGMQYRSDIAATAAAHVRG